MSTEDVSSTITSEGCSLLALSVDEHPTRTENKIDTKSKRKCLEYECISIKTLKVCEADVESIIVCKINT